MSINQDLQKQYIIKVKATTMFKQISKNIEEESGAIGIISSYIDCFHRYLGLEATPMLRVLGMLHAIGDIKFENDDIVILKNDGSEWVRVYAPC